MPTPKIQKRTQQEFEDWYNKNRAWADSHNYSKDIARNIFITKSLQEDGYDIGDSLFTSDTSKLRQFYDVGFSGPNPYRSTPAVDVPIPQYQNPFPFGYDPQASKQGLDMSDVRREAAKMAVASQQNEQTTPNPATSTEGLGYTYSDINSLDRNSQPYQEGFKSIRQDRKNNVNVDLNFLEDQAEHAQKVLNISEYLNINRQDYDSMKADVQDYLLKEGNTWYLKNLHHFDGSADDDTDQWWRETLAEFLLYQNEKGTEYAMDFLHQQIAKRVDEKQTGGEAASNWIQAYGSMFASGILSGAGFLEGIARGIYNAATDAHQGVNFWGELGSGILESKAMQTANQIAEQGTVFHLRDDFDPAIHQSDAYMSSKNWFANGTAMAAYGLSSVVTGGIVAKGLGLAGKGAGRLALHLTREEASRSLARLATETAEEYTKRLAKIEAQKRATLYIKNGIPQIINIGGEAGLDATSVYKETLDYRKDASEYIAANKAYNRLLGELGYVNLEDAARNLAAQSMNDNPDVSADFNTTYNSIKQRLQSKLDSYKKEELEKLDDLDAQGIAVAIKAGNATFLEEFGTLAIAEFVGNKAFTWEGMRNLRRSSSNPMFHRFSGNSHRGVTWTDNKAVVNLTSRASNWGRAGAKYATDQIFTEVLPENIQNFISSANEAVGMNAIDQFIVSRTNSDNSDDMAIGDMGKNRWQTGIRAGWKDMKENALTTSASVFATSFMPDFSGFGRRGVLHRADGVSIGEHLSNYFGPQITRNYYEQENANKHVKFYAENINRMLDENPALQDMVNNGLTLNNLLNMEQNALASGDMAHAQQTELGQLISLMMDIHASNMTAPKDENGNSTHPLDKINQSIDQVLNATFDSELGRQMVEEYKKNNPEFKRSYRLRQSQPHRKSDEQIFDEIKKSAKRMDNIRKSVDSSSDMVNQNFETYDDDIKNALIFGKVFNDAFHQDVQEEKQAAQKIVSDYKARNTSEPTTAKENTATINDINAMTERHSHNERQQQISHLDYIISNLYSLKSDFEKAKSDEERKMAEQAIEDFGKQHKETDLTYDNINSLIRRLDRDRSALIKEQDKAEKKSKKTLEGKDVVFTADDLINADPETRRWLLNRNNWKLLSDESKKNLSTLIDSINSIDPSFEKTARHAANLEVLMKENDEAFAAYIANPDKLTPVYNRVMRDRRNKKNIDSAKYLDSIKDYDTFVSEYKRVTASNMDQLGRRITKSEYLRHRLQNFERNSAINEHLKDNAFYQRYVKTNRINDTVTRILSDRKRREVNKATRIPDTEHIMRKRLHPDDMTKPDLEAAFRAEINEYRDFALWSYFAQNNVDTSDINAIEDALKQMIDGHDFSEGGYLQFSKYAQFVRDFISNDTTNDTAKRAHPDDLIYHSFDEAYSAAVGLLNLANMRIEHADSISSKKDLKDTHIVHKPHEDNNKTKKNNFDFLPVPDVKYSEPVDINNDDPETIARKLTYNFRFTDSQIEALTKEITAYFIKPINNRKDDEVTKREQENINKLISLLGDYQYNHSLGNSTNFYNALNQVRITNKDTDSSICRAHITAELVRDLLPVARKLPLAGNVSEVSEDDITTYLNEKAVETLNLRSVAKSGDATSNDPARRFEHEKNTLITQFAEKLNVLSFLEHPFMNRIVSLASRSGHTPLRILSGDVLVNGEALNDKLQALFGERGEAYDRDRDGALMVAVQIPDNSVDDPGYKLFKDGFVKVKDPIDGKEHHYQVLGFIPSTTMSQNSNIARWRQQNALWDENQDRSTTASSQVLYVANHGFKFSYRPGSQGTPLKHLKKIAASFGQMMRKGQLKPIQDKKGRRDDGNSETYRQLIVRQNVKDAEFTVFLGNNRNDTEPGIRLFVAPMQQTRSISTKSFLRNREMVKYGGETLQEILNDDELGYDKMREMHHYKNGDFESFGRMGHFVFLIRKMLVTGQYDDISTIIGKGFKYNEADQETRERGKNNVFRLPLGCGITYSNEEGAIYLDTPNHTGDKVILDLNPELLNEIEEYKRQNGLDELDEKDLNKALSLTNQHDVLDKIAFQIAKNLILNDAGEIATHEDFGVSDEDATANQSSSKLTDSAVHWHLFYGTSDIATEDGSTKQGSLSLLGYSPANTSGQKATLSIYQDFYENELLLVRDQIENIFVTDDPTSTGSENVPEYDNPVNQFDPKVKQYKQYPSFVQRLIDLSNRLHENKLFNEKNRRTHRITALTTLLNDDQSEFDSSNVWAQVSTGLGNKMDELARDFFADNIRIGKSGEWVYYKNGRETNLADMYPNFSASQLHELLNYLQVEVKQKWQEEGFEFIDLSSRKYEDKLYLNGHLYLKIGEGNYVEYPIVGEPDILAYHPDGRFRIVDVKTKHTKDKDNPTFWGADEDDKHENGENKKTLEQYTAQVNLYGQCITQSLGTSAKIDGLYLLEIPVLYEDPTDVKKNPSRIQHNAVKYTKDKNNVVTKTVGNKRVDFTAQIGKFTLHQRPPMTLDDSFSIIDRYRYLARHHTSKVVERESILDRLRNAETQMEKATLERLVNRVEEDISKTEDAINELIGAWDDATRDDENRTSLPEAAGDVNTTGRPLLSGSVNITSDFKRKLNDKDSVIEMLTNNVKIELNGKDVTEIFSPEMIEAFGIDRDYTIEFKELGSKSYAVNNKDRKFYIGEKFIFNLSKKLNHCSPYVIGKSIKCAI